ncbi:hypothetical protein, partial [Parafrankia sp. FMc2]|uniref:hypothetical protein n=1 Tax=Parafrankia sp. FMc2 TaxID=3233196 RepID=UPI0034D54FA7
RWRHVLHLDLERAGRQQRVLDHRRPGHPPHQVRIGATPLATTADVDSASTASWRARLATG